MAINDRTKTASLPDVDAKAFLSADALANEVIQGLKVAGACIIRHLYSEETIGKLDQEVNPYISEAGNTTCKIITTLIMP